MKNKKRILGFLLTFFLAGYACAQTEIKIGYVETKRLFSESVAAARAQERIQKEFAARQQEINKSGRKVDEAREAFQRDAVTMSESVRRERERALNEMILDQQRKVRQFREDLDFRQRDENAALVEKAARLVIDYGKRNGYTVILNEYGPVGYIDPKIDITNEIIKLFN